MSLSSGILKGLSGDKETRQINANEILSPGQEDPRIIDLLLQLTKISDDKHQAIHDHLVKNFSIGDAAALNGVGQPHLSEAIKTLNAKAEIVEKINELKYTGKVV